MPVSQVHYPQLASEITITARQSGFIHPYCQLPSIGTGDLASLLTCGTKGWEGLVGVLVWEVIKADRHTDVARKADVNAEVDQPLFLGPWGEGNLMNPKGPLPSTVLQEP